MNRSAGRGNNKNNNKTITINEPIANKSPVTNNATVSVNNALIANKSPIITNNTFVKDPNEQLESEFCDVCIQYKLSLNHNVKYDFYCYNC